MNTLNQIGAGSLASAPAGTRSSRGPEILEIFGSRSSWPPDLLFVELQIQKLLSIHYDSVRTLRGTRGARTVSSERLTPTSMRSGGINAEGRL